MLNVTCEEQGKKMKRIRIIRVKQKLKREVERMTRVFCFVSVHTTWNMTS